jgi:hypothetical protein
MKGICEHHAVRVPTIHGISDSRFANRIEGQFSENERIATLPPFVWKMGLGREGFVRIVLEGGLEKHVMFSFLEEEGARESEGRTAF